MAPEIIMNQRYDHRVDIWCLGILLYELLHNEAPYTGKDEYEKVNNMINSKSLKFNKTLSQAGRDLIKSVGLIPYSFSPE